MLTDASDLPARPASTASTLSTSGQNGGLSAVAQGKKRARGGESKLSPAPPAPHSAANRRIDCVVYAGYEIQAQFASPYPLDELPGVPPSNADKAVQGNQTREPGGRFGKKTAGAPTAATGVSGAASNPPVLAPLAIGGENGSPSVATDAEASTSARVISPELGAPMQPLLSPSDSSPAPQADAAGTPAASTSNGQAVSPELGPPSSLAPAADEYSHDFDLPFQLPSAQGHLVETTARPEQPAPSVPPLSLDASHHEASSTSLGALPGPSAPSGYRTERGKGGRFLPKPPGETAKEKRRAERVQRTTAASTDAPHMTQRQQRELARKAREEREREAADRAVEKGPPEEVRLFVCERCLKYMALPAVYLAHQKECDVTRPPGRRVYQRGATSIWEVDGAVAKLYCQNLCLFAKLFIEHKYMFFDVEGFSFYLLTETWGKQEWVLGYFSKEKISYDDYNLACIVVFPPFRQKGWATLLIEFSYELSRRLSATPGTPERPLSELGQRGYVAHWTAVLVRYFRAIFALRAEPSSIDTLLAPRDPSASPTKRGTSRDAVGADDDERERRKRLRRSKGWDGELPTGATPLAASPAKAFTLRPGLSAGLSRRRGRHGLVDPADGSFAFPTELDELAEKVNLRADDVAFALVESGLAQWRRGGADAAVEEVKREDEGEEEEGAGQGDEQTEQVLELVITPELVEEVARLRGVKPMPMLDVAYVCNL
ncbi:uncharacterized protein JCM10292_003470 [Rhodotorula paludigena]|uniref:uncharacterized protein n=1 Tax=Rhodotorula paludigena TaxID=86838 RepID=UPI00317B06B1